jgi:hypothetical protein
VFWGFSFIKNLPVPKWQKMILYHKRNEGAYAGGRERPDTIK